MKRYQVKSVLSTFVVAVAVITFAASGNAEILPTNDGKSGHTVSRPNPVRMTRTSSHDHVETRGSGPQIVLIAQGVEWCYTTYGTYPMAVWSPVGSTCHVNVAFYPYVLYGVVGY